MKKIGMAVLSVILAGGCVWFFAVRQSPLAAMKAQLEQHKSALEEKLEGGIPRFRETLKSQARESLKASSGSNPSPEVKGGLEREYNEIVSALVALDKYERQCKDAHTLISSSLRQLERLSQSKDIMGEDTERAKEAAGGAERKVGPLLATDLSPKGLGGGEIGDLELAKKKEELKQEQERYTPAPPRAPAPPPSKSNFLSVNKDKDTEGKSGPLPWLETMSVTELVSENLRSMEVHAMNSQFVAECLMSFLSLAEDDQKAVIDELTKKSQSSEEGIRRCANLALSALRNLSATRSSVIAAWKHGRVLERVGAQDAVLKAAGLSNVVCLGMSPSTRAKEEVDMLYQEENRMEKLGAGRKRTGETELERRLAVTKAAVASVHEHLEPKNWLWADPGETFKAGSPEAEFLRAEEAELAKQIAAIARQIAEEKGKKGMGSAD